MKKIKYNNHIKLLINYGYIINFFNILMYYGK
jgi:hypothetical protein